MDISRLKEFLDLADTLSFTKTSRNMNVSQSALSRHIADLERETGATLLDRTTSSVRLTPAGRAFYEQAVTMVRGYESLLKATSAAKREHKTTLRVSGNTMQSFPNRLLFSLALCAGKDGLPLRLGYHKTRSLSNEPPVPATLDMLRSGEIDLSVEVLPFDAELPRGTEGLRVAYEPLLALASPDCPLGRRDHLRLEDLRGLTPVALAAYRSCPAMELAPLEAAGVNIEHAKTVFVQNMLEIPEVLAELKEDEVVLLEEGFCRERGISDSGKTRSSMPDASPTEQTGSRQTCRSAVVVTLPVEDARLRLSYWLLARENDKRAEIRQVIGMARDLVSQVVSTNPSCVHEDGTPWVDAY